MSDIRLIYLKLSNWHETWNDSWNDKGIGPFPVSNAVLSHLYINLRMIKKSYWIVSGKKRQTTNDEMKAKAKIFDTTISAEILGHNEELYGYLIYRSADRANVKIIDEQTVKPNYHYVRNYSN